MMMGVFSSLEKALEKVAMLPKESHADLYIKEYEVDASLNRSILEVGTVVWNGLNEEDRKKVDRLMERVKK